MMWSALTRSPNFFGRSAPLRICLRAGLRNIFARTQVGQYLLYGIWRSMCAVLRASALMSRRSIRIDRWNRRWR